MKGERDIGGWTALMRAARNGCPGCVRLLLERETGIQDDQSWTALMWAVYYRKSDCVTLLAEKERTITTTRAIYRKNDNRIYPSESTALDVARLKGHYELAKVLSYSI